eukprot:INCI7204.2.p1 GENE.INCI7204.2~~INCI7204.2.p1  ORF type:complete len:208 (-),score=38.26 INCI7204.2:621-1244(-)
MAFVLYGAVATLGSSRVLARALTDKVVLPRDTPHEVKPETVMDEMAKNILQKAPKGANCKNSTALADNSLVAHLWNTHDTCYLLIVTPAIDNAIVQQLWLVMEREFARCRKEAKTAQAFEKILGNCFQACNQELDDVVAKSQRKVPRPGDDDVVIQAVRSIASFFRGEVKCTKKLATKCLGTTISVFFTILAVIFAIISCPLKGEES